jgi:hypothetical protein
VPAFGGEVVLACGVAQDLHHQIRCAFNPAAADFGGVANDQQLGLLDAYFQKYVGGRGEHLAFNASLLLGVIQDREAA